MASEKVTEVEMEKITPAEDRGNEDTEKDKVREAKDKELEESEKENGDDNEDSVYSQLNSPTGDIYSLASNPTSLPKPQNVYRKVTLYRRLAAILLLLCVVLLGVLLALAVKLSEAKSSMKCPTSAVDVEKTTVADRVRWQCSLQECEDMFPRELVHDKLGHACSECGKGWLKFDDSCYFLSKTRLNWLESREKCNKFGGDLVVISNERVQRFLTSKGLLMYWIGLSRSDSQQWTWINNTALTNSYWAGNPNDGHCVFLSGGKMPKRNWFSNPCTAASYYICQKD